MGGGNCMKQGPPDDPMGWSRSPTLDTLIPGTTAVPRRTYSMVLYIYATTSFCCWVPGVQLWTQTFNVRILVRIMYIIPKGEKKNLHWLYVRLTGRIRTVVLISQSLRRSTSTSTGTQGGTGKLVPVVYRRIDCDYRRYTKYQMMMSHAEPVIQVYGTRAP